MASKQPASPRRWKVFLAALLIIAAMVLAVRNLRTPPQMGADEETFKTVDALFTAITSRDRSRLDDCERRLHDHRAAGRLPGAAAKYLDQVIAQSRSGGWEPAGQSLYNFMYQQRRK